MAQPTLQRKVLHVQSIGMKVTRNKRIIFKRAFIIHIYGLHYYRGKLTKLFSEYR
jgi:hypothetical protein